MEVPQIQFFDVKVVEQSQFLDKVAGGPGQLSMLEGVQYIDKLLMCLLVVYEGGTFPMQCLARQWIHVPFTLVRFWTLRFLREGKSDPKVDISSCSPVYGSSIHAEWRSVH